MNPLDMTGPEFLRFYLAYGLCGLAVAGLLRILWNRSVADNPQLRWTPGYYPRDSEAYGIALLRGGRKEAARTLLSRLMASGYIAVEDGDVVKTEKAKDLFSLDPLERQSLQCLAPIQTPSGAEFVVESHTGTGLDEVEQDLERQGLIPPQDARNRLLGLLFLTLLVVPGLGILKLAVALGRGRTNIGFLVILLVVYTAVACVLLLPPRRTAAGRRYLAWLQDSHQGLRDLLASGRREDAGETVLAAGIFGIGALPMLAGLSHALLPPPPPPRRKEDGSGGCGGGDVSGGGSSCSGGSSCGGGSGCGGGGCGGGGCGGCGS